MYIKTVAMVVYRRQPLRWLVLWLMNSRCVCAFAFIANCRVSGKRKTEKVVAKWKKGKYPENSQWEWLQPIEADESKSGYSKSKCVPTLFMFHFLCAFFFCSASVSEFFLQSSDGLTESARQHTVSFKLWSTNSNQEVFLLSWVATHFLGGLLSKNRFTA